MRSLVGILAGALLLGAVTMAGAQTVEPGIVIRTDPQANVVVLDDGRVYRVTPNTMLVVENRATPLTALRPGQRVMVQSGEVVVLRDGQYVALAPAPATAVPVGVRQTFHGTVTSVDRDGEVKIKTERDSFEIKVGTEALRSIKKGDNVTLDLTITPPGAPSALPRQ